MGEESKRVGRWGCFLVLGLCACTREPRPLPSVPESPAQPPEETRLAREADSCDTERLGSPLDVPLDGLSAGPAPDAPVVTSSLGSLALRARSDGRLVELLGDTGAGAGAGAGAEGALELGGRKLLLTRLELHTPTEHRLGGVSAALEVTLWFEGAGAAPASNASDSAVPSSVAAGSSSTPAAPIAFSLLFRSGRDNPSLTPLLDVLPPRSVYEARELDARLDLAALLPAEGLVFSYEGTGTLPPCAPVTRLVLAQMGELSDAQLEKLGRALGSSSRTPVPQGDRAVVLLPLRSAPSAP